MVSGWLRCIVKTVNHHSNPTLCSITKAAELGVYESIQEILNLKTVPISNLSSLKSTSSSYYELLAHAKRDMIFK